MLMCRIFQHYAIILLLVTNQTTIAMQKPILWDWQQATPEQTTFPANFEWGIAMAEFQNSGAAYLPQSNWAHWETRTYSDGTPHIKNGHVSGDACKHWSSYQEDIALMQELGLTSCRLSVDWSAIEPEEGRFNAAALDHYKQECAALRAVGIRPMVTLHHFVHPQWFEDRGGWAKEKNIDYFIRFVGHVVAELMPLIDLWCTINEPGVLPFQGYMHGAFPPGDSDFELAGRVLLNLLRAHVRAYWAIKGLPGGDKAQIGIVHNYMVFEPYSSWNPLEWLPAKFMTHVFNDVIMTFLRTGKYAFYYAPLLCISGELPNAPHSFDFIGLNYYSRVVVRMFARLSNMIAPSGRDGEIMTDMPYPLYPEGIYAAIEQMHSLGKPIYITECGIADAQDTRRETFIRRYLYAVAQAVKKGYDVRGFYYWTLMDNFEWEEGFSMKFGLYSCDPQSRNNITLRKGAEYYRALITKNRALLP